MAQTMIVVASYTGLYEGEVEHINCPHPPTMHGVEKVDGIPTNSKANDINVLKENLRELRENCTSQGLNLGPHWFWASGSTI